MAVFDPDSISQSHLQHFRNAAESAWADDTRHPDFQGDPQPSGGQCYVTSRWLQEHLGGHVGTKSGHYFWVSPDKQYVIDLTGDQYAFPPIDPRVPQTLQDEDDEVWQPPDDHQQWRPGPVVYTRSTHPLYKGFRVREYPNPNQRATLFAKRANMALEHKLPPKHAEGSGGGAGMGGDAYPGSTPQFEENFHNKYLHDSLTDLELTQETPHAQEYHWFFGNGQVHVSPFHSHDELREHAGVSADDSGPIAAGVVNVEGGTAYWSAESNVSIRGLARELEEYCVPLDTEILTREGWKKHDQVQEGDETIGYDPHQEKNVWTTITRVHHLGVQPLVRIGHSHWEAVVTPSHRWYAKWKSKWRDKSGKIRKYHKEGFVETKDLGRNHHLILSAPFIDGDGEITIDEATLIAWLYTDGTMHRSGDKNQWINANVWQTKETGCIELDDLMSRLPITKRLRTGGGFAYHVETSYIRDLLKRSGLWDREKSLIDFVLGLSPDALNGFVHAAWIAEGQVTRDDNFKTISQNQGETYEALMLATYLLGYRPSVTHSCYTPNGKNDHISQCIPRVHLEHMVREDYGSGEVWCVTTELGSWTMRQGTRIMLTGNCKSMGWKWGGLGRGNGELYDDEFGPKKSYWFGWESGVQISEHPFFHALGRVTTRGRTAFMPRVSKRVREGLEEWASDFGYRLADYPGGGDMTDKIKRREDLELYNRGNPDKGEVAPLHEGVPQGDLTCPICGDTLPDFMQYTMHIDGHDGHPREVEDGHFPTIEKSDEPLQLRPMNSEMTGSPLE